MARRASYLKKRRFSKSANNVLDRHESSGSMSGNLDSLKQVVGKFSWRNFIFRGDTGTACNLTLHEVFHFS